MSSEIASRLSEQTKRLISRFEARVSSFNDRDDLLTLARELDAVDADAYARDFFGEGEHSAVGIDGSMGYDERMQMILFYSNATAYSCPFKVGDRLSFDLAAIRRGAKLSASSAVPLWAEDLSDVAHDVSEVDLELEHSMERIPNAFMTIAELYLAVKAAEDARIIFLDRPLSGTYSTLSRDVRLLLKRDKTNLARLVDRDERSVLLDISLGLYLGSPSMMLPLRRRYAPQRIIRELMRGPCSKEELAQRLSTEPRLLEKECKRLVKFDSDMGGLLLDAGEGSRLVLKADAVGYWDRLVSLALAYCQGIYEKGLAALNFSGDEWLTVLDVNTLAFVLLERLCELSQERSILLLGIAKDTTATDISRSVLPFAERNGFVTLSRKAPVLSNDRAFLSILSATNMALKIPWRTAGYDSAFSTMTTRHDGDGESSFRSARKVVSREQLFVRGFFQSRSMGGGRVRSQVFLFDRAFDREEDIDSVHEVEVEEERTGRAVIQSYYEGAKTSRKSNLALRVLALTDNPEVYEAFGHNQLLYLADKAVKAEMRLMRNSLRGVADLRMGTTIKREEVYGIVTSYRDQRSEAEAARMRAGPRSVNEP